MTAERRVAGLFSGIGGIELGFMRSGWRTLGLCEIDAAARAVLRSRFELPPNRLWKDVSRLSRIPHAELVTAGFPCQDLSQAGRKVGIRGSQSGLVEHVFRLVDEGSADSILLENVSYMLRLDKGDGMRFLVEQLERRGYDWAYRVVDSRSFGVPQRRQRVLFLASRTTDPSAVLHADDAPDAPIDDHIGSVDFDAAYGFYWTEGLRGLGWTKNAVPTIKGGSRIGIPSPPAVWIPRTGFFGTPSIEDAESLQGFDAGWTEPALDAGVKAGARWSLVGNAVCVPMSEWVATRLDAPGTVSAATPTLASGRWPAAARGTRSGIREAVDVSMFVDQTPFSLESSLRFPLKPLSAKASAGFLRRAEAGKLRFPEGFLDSLRCHLQRMESPTTSAA
jgi:DNA (cytosine-5)-methyltransferase 1